MNIAVGSDHRGYEAKRKLIPLLKKLGHEIKDFGANGSGIVDYPDIAVPVSQSVAEGRFEIGVLLDGNGIGMSMVANKVKGIRAALVHDEVTARHAREQNHCNIICVGTDLHSEEQVRKIVENFINTKFAEGRHARRVEKIARIEQSVANGTLI
jgi:ribose 5-phosphate isomerase B